MFIRPILMTPNLTNMTKITTLQALIESSMPAELKKCNETPKKIARTLNLHTNLQHWQVCKILISLLQGMPWHKKSKNIVRNWQNKSKLTRWAIIAKILACKNRLLKNAQYLCTAWVNWIFYSINQSFIVCWKDKYLIVF